MSRRFVVSITLQSKGNLTTKNRKTELVRTKTDIGTTGTELEHSKRFRTMQKRFGHNCDRNLRVYLTSWQS